MMPSCSGYILVLLGCPALVATFALEEVSVTVDAHGDVAAHQASAKRRNSTQRMASLIRVAEELPTCPTSERVAVGDECTCGEETCKKGQFCYSADEGKETCQDDEKKDPSLIDWYGITKNGPQDDRDNGPLNGRTFKFLKKQEGSTLRFMYTDNFRSYGGSSSSANRWEIKIDGKSCPSGSMYQDLYQPGYQNPHRVNSWSGFCKGIGKGEHQVQVHVGKTSSYKSDASTGWSWTGTKATVHLEVQEVPENYPFFSQVSGAKNDGKDVGWVPGREVKFKKVFKDSTMRFTYSDNLRVHAGTRYCACRWHVRVDGKECSSGTIIGDVYIHPHENCHRPRSMHGFCEDISAGDHKAQVYVSQTPGYSSCDCYTGWLSSHFVLEAEEIPKPYDMVHYIMKHQSDGRNSGDLAGYKLSFKKKHDETRLRLLFTENLRAYSTSRNCCGSWEIMINGKSCPSVKIWGHVYVHRAIGSYASRRRHHVWNVRDTNPHRVRTFAGFCDNVKAGDHTLTVRVGTINGACDLYTGWKNSPGGKGGHGLLEAHEFFKPCSELDSKADCAKPRCFWEDDACVDLIECPGSDKVAAGVDCVCGEEKMASGKYCYEDNTVHDAAKEEKQEAKSAARQWAACFGLLIPAAQALWF